MPLRKFKFHKHKHKGSNWITNGIIHSIKYCAKLYRTLKQTPSNAVNYLTLRQNLKLYNNILRKIIREAKRLYYHKQFNKYFCESKKNLEHSYWNEKSKQGIFFPRTFLY